MKVIHVYKDYYPPVKGGIEGHINILSNGLMKRDIDVEVLVSNSSPKLEVEYINGIKITKVPQIGRIVSAPLNLNLPEWIKSLGSSADLLHFHLPNPTATLSYQFSSLNKKAVVTYHSDIIRQKNLNIFYSPFLHKFLRSASAIVTTSPNYRESSLILSRYKEKCVVIPLGICLDRFKYKDEYNEKINKIRKYYGKPIILFIGRFRYYKGLHILIRAMKKVDGLLLLIGTGPLEKTLKRQVRESGLNEKVIFLGELNDDDVNLFLHACDILSLPSIQRSEAFGIVQLEAMACGKPVVSTELSTGTSYVNQHLKTGLIVPPFDDEALANAMNTLILRPELRIALGNAGKEHVQEKFSSEMMVESFINLYKKILYDPNLIGNNNGTFNKSSIYDFGLNKKIKVLRIISRLNIGGPATHVVLLNKGLDKTKYQSELVIGNISNNEGDMSYLIKPGDKKPIRIPELQREINIKNDIKAFIKIYRIIRRQQPDIVHSHLAKAGATTRVAVWVYNLTSNKQIKTVHTFHGHIFQGYFNRSKSRIIQLIEQMIAKSTDSVIAISRTQKNELTSKYKISTSDKIKIIKLGFDLRPFFECHRNKGKLRKKLGVDEDTILIGIIGRLVPIKNHHMFFYAAKRFIDINKDIRVKFIIVGDGELMNELQDTCKKLDLEKYMVFCGWIKEIPIVYADLDIVALTSLNEGTSVSIIEAMAASVPTIATNVGGVRDLLGPSKDDFNHDGFKICNRGIMCRSNDPEAFANGLAYMIKKDKIQNARRIVRAREYVKTQYSSERLIREIEDLYSTFHS